MLAHLKIGETPTENMKKWEKVTTFRNRIQGNSSGEISLGMTDEIFSITENNPRAPPALLHCNLCKPFRIVHLHCFP